MTLHAFGFGRMLSLIGVNLQTLRLFNRNSTAHDSDSIIRAVGRSCPKLVALDLVNFPFLRKHISMLPVTLRSLFLGIEEDWSANTLPQKQSPAARLFPISKSAAARKRQKNVATWKQACVKAIVALAGNRTLLPDLDRIEVQVELCDSNDDDIDKDDESAESSPSRKDGEFGALLVHDVCAAVGIQLTGLFSADSSSMNPSRIVRHFSTFHAP